MKNALLVFCTIGFLTACKMDAGNENSTPTKGVGEINSKEQRVFSSSEMKIIKSLCTNLKAKREYFTSLDDMTVRFKFKIDNLNCNKVSTSVAELNTRLSNTNSTYLEYYSDRTDYLKDVITDQTPGYQYLCDNAEAKNLNNYYSDSSYTYNFNVLINQGFQRVEIVKSKMDNGKSVTISSEGIDFITETFQAPRNYFGMEKNRTKYTVCSNGNIKSLNQMWLTEP